MSGKYMDQLILIGLRYECEQRDLTTRGTKPDLPTGVVTNTSTKHTH